MRVMGGLNLLIMHCVQQLNGDGFFCDQILRDLETRGLIQPGTRGNVAMTLPGLMSPHISEIGKEFLRFIS
jgi:hypothetical protein